MFRRTRASIVGSDRGPAVTKVDRPHNLRDGIGNQARLRTLTPRPSLPSAFDALPKYAVGPIDDPLEREARGAGERVAGNGNAGAALRAPTTTAHAELTNGGGDQLDPALKQRMQSGFAADFNDVRVHTDDRSQHLNRNLGSRAFTLHNDIFLGDPTSARDRTLLGHELAHVVQQRREQRSGTEVPPLIQRDASSDDFKQGYEDGLSGDESHGAPRDGDALVDYNEGYAKGRYEYGQRKDGGHIPSQTGPAGATAAVAGMIAPLAAGVSPVPAPLSPGPLPSQPPPEAFRWSRVPEFGEGAPGAAEPAAAGAAEGAGITAEAGGLTAEGALTTGGGALAEESAAGLLTEAATTTLASTAPAAAVPVWGWVVIGVAIVATVGYVGYKLWVLSKDQKPTRPATPSEETQAQTNQGKSPPVSLPGLSPQPTAQDPGTGQPLITPGDGDYSPIVDPATGTALEAPGATAPDSARATSYNPPPRTLPAFPDATPGRPKTSMGGGKLRRRWITPEGDILEWDYQHGTVERYDKRGRHLGEFDPNTGAKTDDADPSRKVTP